MYLAVIKLIWLLREALNWVRIHALRIFASNFFQGGFGNTGERAAKLPLSDWRYPLSVVLALLEAAVLSIWQVCRWLFFFNTRSVPEFVLSGIKLVFVLAILSVAGLYGYLSGEPDPEVLAEYRIQHQHLTATALLGQEGSLIGAMANPQQTGESRVGGLYAEIVPPVYWDMLDYSTGRQLELNYQDTGVTDLLLRRKTNYKGIASAQLIQALNPWSASNTKNVVVDLSQNLKGQPGRCLGVFDRLCEALSSIRFAKHAFPYLAANNGAELKRWTAMHGALQGYSDDVRGLRAVSETVFSKRPEQLSNAEQALFAVAQLAEQPLLEVSDWSALLEQAGELANRLYGQQQPALANEIQRDLSSLKGSRVVTTANADNLSPQAALAQPHLLKRGAVVLSHFSELVSERLNREYQLTQADQIISDVQVSLPVVDNMAFEKGILARLKDIERTCNDCGLQRSLGPEPEAGGAQIQIMVANAEGRLVRYFSRGDIEDRATGALSSLPAAVLLASRGNNLPETRFCNQTYRNLPSSVKDFPSGIVNCETLDEPGHSLSFQEAIQARASLPLFYALRKYATPEQLQTLYKQFDIKDLRSRQGKATHAEQLAYEMSYGVMQSTPLNMLDVIHQISEMLYGSGEAHAVQSISQFLINDLGESRRYLDFGKSPSQITIVGNYLRTATAKATLRQLLQYEITPPDGALHLFSRLTNAKFLLTKSGQSYTKQQILRDQWLLASVIIRGQRYSVSVFVGSPIADEAGLAENLIAARLLFPIMAEIVDSLD